MTYGTSARLPARLSPVNRSAMARVGGRHVGQEVHFTDLRHVLVAAPAHAEQHRFIVRPAAAFCEAIQLTACAVSSAGMIPSSRLSSWNPSSASSSVTATYCARPLSLRNECSGPDARIVEARRDRVRRDAPARTRPEADSSASRGARPGARARATPSGGRCRALRPPLRRRPAPRRGRRRTRETRPSRSSRRPRTRRPSAASRPTRSSICARASRPMTDWKSRTIRGYGAGPTTEPMM